MVWQSIKNHWGISDHQKGKTKFSVHAPYFSRGDKLELVHGWSFSFYRNNKGEDNLSLAERGLTKCVKEYEKEPITTPTRNGPIETQRLILTNSEIVEAEPQEYLEFLNYALGRLRKIASEVSRQRGQPSQEELTYWREAQHEILAAFYSQFHNSVTQSQTLTPEQQAGLLKKAKLLRRKSRKEAKLEFPGGRVVWGRIPEGVTLIEKLADTA